MTNNLKPNTNLPITTNTNTTTDTSTQTPIEIALQIDENGMTTALIYMRF